MATDAQVKITEDIRQSPEYGRYLATIGWEVIPLQKSDANAFLKKIGPISLVKIQRTKTAPDPDELKKLLSDRKVFMCKVEPNEQIPTEQLRSLNRNGFKLCNSPLLGTKTSRIDISPNNDEVFSKFKKDCRYCIRKVTDINETKVELDDADGFYEIWKKSAKRKNLWIPPEKDYKSLLLAFGKKALAITVNNHAGAVILIHKKTAFYYYAGATAGGVRDNLPYLVVWEAMKEAKKRGCMIWDFEGVFDNRWPNKGWSGFTHFKQSFSGVEIEYPGSFEKWRWPF